MNNQKENNKNLRTIYSYEGTKSKHDHGNWKSSETPQNRKERLNNPAPYRRPWLTGWKAALVWLYSQ